VLQPLSHQTQAVAVEKSGSPRHEMQVDNVFSPAEVVSRLTREMRSSESQVRPDKVAYGKEVAGKTGYPSDNVIFLKAEATEFLEALPPAIVLRKIFILYPDPWPKKKHHKNRFINAANLDLLARRAAAGTRLHFRTDDADYFEWTRAHVAEHAAWKLKEATTWPFEQTTFFEERMKEKRDLEAERVP
ncbi:MAG: hypothetical protein EBX95_14555, partial [Acidimicrobiia bacterium]|nr:hypothetical protein [Acidimicrobiia bacterium]